MRARRDQDTERWDVRLDAALREILERANDFVPSEAGGILLDDPRAKLAGVRTPRLTFIAVYGPNSRPAAGPAGAQRARASWARSTGPGGPPAPTA